MTFTRTLAFGALLVAFASPAARADVVLFNNTASVGGAVARGR
jgi:hypothetical protein